MWGMAFGLASAVVNFNRFPMLGVAICRRCCCAMSAAYFDDELSVEMLQDAAVSKLGLQLVFRLMGSATQVSKSYPTAMDRHYLGSSLHVGDVPSEGVVVIQPKEATRFKVACAVQQALSLGNMSPDAAGKLRGDLQWFFSMSTGRAGRLAGPLLQRLQCREEPLLESDDLEVLQFLLAVIRSIGPREVSLFPGVGSVVRVYSDASWENGHLRLGWVIFGLRSVPLGRTAQVPDAIISQWTPRKTQIYPGEALCALAVPLLHAGELRGADVLWFIDNEAAASAVIRGQSKTEDVHGIALTAAMCVQHLNARVWVEWIDSESNPSDGLSRAGVSDPWTCSQPWQLAVAHLPHWLGEVASLQDAWQRAERHLLVSDPAF